MAFTLLRPIWLLLLIPLIAGLWWLPLPTRLLQVLRICLLSLICAGMAGLAIQLPIQSGTVVVLVDRSLSMPGNSDSGAREVIDHLSRAMSSRDQLGVVAFGESASIEQAPEHAAFNGFVQNVGTDGSNLSEGIDKALALIPRDSPGSVVVLSDGRWTGADPITLAARAADRGVRIDYRSIQRPIGNDLSVARFETPSSLNTGESFTLAGFVHSPVAQDVDIELTRNGLRLASGSQHLMPGMTRVVFRDTAVDAGTLEYHLAVHSKSPDPVPENNVARALVGVEGSRPILLASESGESDLATLLRAGKLNVKTVKASDAKWTLESLSNYSAILLEDAPAQSLGTQGMETLAAWVESGGGGLALTGGRKSFGPGGYFKSPIDPILPVSMELRQEHRKLSMAIVVVMDRSGSMGMPVGNGRSKMDLADLGAAQVLDLMSPTDDLGVIAVDTTPHVIASLRPVGTEKAASRNRILGVASEGGGIYIDVAMHAAEDWIVQSTPQTKHVILFADAADSEQGGDSSTTVGRLNKAGITVSVIGMGKPTDCDVALLQNLAKIGGGRFYLTDNVEELPRLFAQDTFVVARSTFVDEPTSVQFTGGISMLSNATFTDPPSIGGYNLCYVRPGAQLGALTRDQYKAPVVAAWQAGLGRVAVYTGEASGKHTGEIAKWSQIGQLHASLGRWIAGAQSNLADHMMVTQEVRSGVCTFQLHLDPQRTTPSLPAIPIVTTLRGHVGEKPTVVKAPMRWTSPDLLELSIPLHGQETALSTVTIQGAGQVSLPPVCLPYSPEFEPLGDRRMTSLSQLARATGGDELIDSGSLWQKLPRPPRFVDLSPVLLIGAVVLLLIEVLERRTGMVSAGMPMLLLSRALGWIGNKSGRKNSTVAEGSGQGGQSGNVGSTSGASGMKSDPVRTPPWERGKAKEKPPGVITKPTKPTDSPPDKPAGSVMDALREARDRSKNRTDGKK